ncbi:MAG: NAD(P)/FAD-dependent oxidoreductase [Deltaproteobacteria bacterium]|nr:NAD(P)/FAD-dependent oxidoreductase [Deltaproteobacteria bacterium]
MLDADTIVIGSGAGGLTAALALAQAGERVLVLERHAIPGGLCQSFQKGGYRFSPGVHYIGELGPGGSLRSIYEGLGVAGDLTFLEMNPQGFEHIYIGDEIFDLPSGKDAMVERFTERFPDQAKGIHDYLHLVYTVCKEMACIPDTKSFLDFLTVPYRTRHMGRYGLYSLERILRERISDPLLRAFLSIQCGDHGLPPSKVPFVLHAPVAGHYVNGGYYPLGGATSIPTALIRGLRREGGNIWLSSPVEKILIEKRGGRRHAIGVRLGAGVELRANRVVSNATPHVTYERLVGRQHLSSGLRRKLDRTTYSIAALTLFLATDLDLESMGMDSGNYWYAPSGDFESIFVNAQDPDTVNDPLPGLCFGITSIKDPSNSQSGHHTIEVVRLITYEAFRPYAATIHGSRPEGYIALKSKLTAAILSSLQLFIAGIGDHVVFSELGTPLTNDHYVDSTRGGCYGTEKVLKQIGPFSFKQFSEIDGLCLCGASTLGHGVSGATMSGLALAGGILGCRPKELLRATGHELRIIQAGQRDH